MSYNNAAVAKAISHAIDRSIQNKMAKFGTAVWNGAESEDSNLSNITYDDSECRYVPKLSGVSPSAGQSVFVINTPGIGVLILGIIVGDRTIPAQ